jgi:hypothetical protein
MNGINQTYLANVTAWQTFVKENSAFRHSFTGVRLGDSDEHYPALTCPTSYPCTVVYYYRQEEGRSYICYEFVYMMQTPREVIEQIKLLANERLFAVNAKQGGMEKAAEWQELENLMKIYEQYLED